MISARTFVTVFKRTVGTIVLSALAIWIADWLILQIRVSRGGGVDTVSVRHHFAVHIKNKRIEQDMQPLHDEECVRSLFSHNDEQPCWYLEKHANDAEDVNSSPWRFWNDQ